MWSSLLKLYVKDNCFKICALGKYAFNILKCICEHVAIPKVHTRTGKPGKMGRHFQVREKSENFEQTGKFRENHTKYWKIQGISEKFYLLLLPPANKFWGKVMFLHLSVILLIGGGGSAPLYAGIHTPP